MTTLKKRIMIPHGVVFIYDPTMIIDVPEDTGSGPLLYTENCISVWTAQEEEARTLLTLSDDHTAARGDPVLEVMLNTEGQRLAFNDSSVNPILDIAVSNTITKVALFTNHHLYPDSVTCVVQ
jgi:hypothetical protein